MLQEPTDRIVVAINKRQPARDVSMLALQYATALVAVIAAILLATIH